MTNQPAPLRRAYRLVAVGIVFLTALSASLSVAPPTLAVTTPFTVTWGSPQNVTGSGPKSVFPAVAVDTNNHTHIAYFDQDNQQLMYTNNVNGSFSAPKVIETGVGTGTDPDLVVGSDNVLHLGYSDSGLGIYYRRGTLSGANVTWAPRQLISSEGKSFGGRLAIDNQTGTLHIAWINNSCGDYNVYYRSRSASGSLGPVIRVRDNGCKYQTHPRLAVTNDGKVHITFEDDKSGKEAYYGRLEGGSFVTQNLSHTSTNTYNPAITSDGTALYVAWEEGIGVGDHDIEFIRSVDGGLNWSSTVGYSTGSSYGSFPALAYSPSSRRVLAAWGDNDDTTASEVWFREFNPDTGLTTAPERLTNLAGASDIPSIAAGSTKAAIAWQDKSTGVFQIFDLQGTITGGGGGTGCDGTLALTDGDQTKNTTLTGTITPKDNCQPDDMQVSLDAPITSATAKVGSYSSTLPPQVVTTGGCVHTVYVRLFRGGAGGAIFSDSIKIDPSKVDASVNAVNPYMSGLPGTYTQSSIAAVTDDGRARDGDPRYTRIQGFFLKIDDAGDCTGLASFQIQNGGADTIPDGGIAAVKALPQGTSSQRTFNIEVTDKIGNHNAFGPFTLYYDPTRPVLNGGSVTGDNNTNTIIRKLTFSNVNVTDNEYGQNGESADFWGIWVANANLTATPNITPDNPNLNWAAVQIPTPGSSFSFDWSLFSGLNYAPDQSHSGTYKVFVRVLDGAGNPSTGVMQATLTLAPGYSVPKNWMPLIRR
jgi:hypothetical protein